MKAQIKVEEVKKVFQPFTLEITVESERELHELWHRFNAPPGRYDKAYCDGYGDTSPSLPMIGAYTAWVAVNDRWVATK